MTTNVFAIYNKPCPFAGEDRYFYPIDYVTAEDHENVRYETILGRHTRQFGDLSIYRITPENSELVRRDVPNLLFCEKNDLIVEALLRHKDRFSDERNIFIKGNVWFTDRAIREILAAPEDGISIFGRLEASIIYGGGSSIFAVVWPGNMNGAIVYGLNAAGLRASAQGDTNLAESLFPLASFLCGQPLNTVNSQTGGDLWHEIDDYTAMLSSWDFYSSWKIAYANRFIFQAEFSKFWSGRRIT